MHVCTLWAHLRLCTVDGAAVKKKLYYYFYDHFLCFFLLYCHHNRAYKPLCNHIGQVTGTPYISSAPVD